MASSGRDFHRPAIRVAASPGKRSIENGGTTDTANAAVSLPALILIRGRVRGGGGSMTTTRASIRFHHSEASGPQGRSERAVSAVCMIETASAPPRGSGVRTSLRPSALRVSSWGCCGSLGIALSKQRRRAALSGIAAHRSKSALLSWATPPSTPAAKITRVAIMAVRARESHRLDPQFSNGFVWPKFLGPSSAAAPTLKWLRSARIPRQFIGSLLPRRPTVKWLRSAKLLEHTRFSCCRPRWPNGFVRPKSLVRPKFLDHHQVFSSGRRTRSQMASFGQNP